MEKKFHTYEEVCAELNISPDLLPDVSMLPEADRIPVINHYKIMNVVKAHNGDWTPDWNDNTECKYYPWFDMETYGDNPPGSGFSCDVYADSSADTAVGSRLCLRSAELAMHVGEIFLELYRGYFK